MTSPYFNTESDRMLRLKIRILPVAEKRVLSLSNRRKMDTEIEKEGDTTTGWCDLIKTGIEKASLRSFFSAKLNVSSPNGRMRGFPKQRKECWRRGELWKETTSGIWITPISADLIEGGEWEPRRFQSSKADNDNSKGTKPEEMQQTAASEPSYNGGVKEWGRTSDHKPDWYGRNMQEILYKSVRIICRRSSTLIHSAVQQALYVLIREIQNAVFQMKNALQIQPALLWIPPSAGGRSRKAFCFSTKVTKKLRKLSHDLLAFIHLQAIHELLLIVLRDFSMNNNRERVLDCEEISPPFSLWTGRWTMQRAHTALFTSTVSANWTDRVESMLTANGSIIYA